MLGVAAALLVPAPASAWGDEGHEVIALIANHYLEPAVRRRVQAILEADTSGLTSRDIAHEATWADKYRDSDRNTTGVRYKQTRNWHFVDLEVEGADLSRACHGRPALPPGTDASRGPAEDCVVDKIDEFSRELKAPHTRDPERLLALEYLLHFVGDVHQPLHAGDDHDQGGNRKTAEAPGIAANTLHHDWDTEFVARLGTNETEIAQRLIAGVTKSMRARWSAGTATDWALESYAVAKANAYGLLPVADSPGHYRLTADYVADATTTTALQLQKAGVRLAWLLNRDLSRRERDRQPLFGTPHSFSGNLRFR